MKDQVYIAKCGHEIRFTIREQEFFAEHGWPRPVRCKPCQRDKKKRYEESILEKEAEKRRRESSPFAPFLGKDFTRSTRGSGHSGKRGRV